jgi:hypothetical protein
MGITHLIVKKQETILVTGAAGGVGSTAQAAIATLLEQGHRVRAMVRKLDTRSDTLRDKGARSRCRRHARHHRRARGHAWLLSGLFHHIDFAKLPGSGRQHRRYSQEPRREGRGDGHGRGTEETASISIATPTHPFTAWRIR